MECDTDNFYETLRASISTALERTSIDTQRAAQIANDAAARVCNNLGGQTLYIPVRRKQTLLKRDAEIFAAFRGNNAPELSVRYGLSVVRVYQILKQERERRAKSAAALTAAPE